MGGQISRNSSRFSSTVLVGGPAHEGGDHTHAQLLAGQDDLFQVGDIGRPLLQILVHGVGVKGQGGELHAPLLAVAQDIGGLLVGEAVHVDVAHPGVAHGIDLKKK